MFLCIPYNWSFIIFTFHTHSRIQFAHFCFVLFCLVFILLQMYCTFYLEEWLTIENGWCTSNFFPKKYLKKHFEPIWTSLLEYYIHQRVQPITTLAIFVGQSQRCSTLTSLHDGRWAIYSKIAGLEWVVIDGM